MRGEYPLPEDVEIIPYAPGQYGGTFVIDWDEPITFNFLVPNSYATNVIIGMLMGGLVTSDPETLEVLPALAKSWDISEDGRSYTFHLRRGIRFSDGEPLTADDVIFTFDCIYDERYPNRYGYQYQQGGKPFAYEKIDDYTVRFTTPDIFAPFMKNIGWAKILPEHVLRPAFEDGTLLKQWSAETARVDPSSIVGTGPFTIQAFIPGERIVLQPNPHYWKADKDGQRLPYINHFVWRFISEINTRNINFFSGQTDSLDPVGAANIVWLDQNADKWGYEIINQGPDTSIGFFWFNQHPGKNEAGELYMEPHKLAWFSDRNFRQAIMHALDREGLAEGPYLGQASPLHSVIAPGNKAWYNPDVPKYDYDPGKSRELLAQSGFTWNDQGRLMDKDGNEVEFILLVPQGGSPRLEAVLNTIRENMDDIGIKMTISFIDFGTLIRKTDNTFDYDAAMMGFTGGGDPSGGKSMYISSGQHHAWYPEQPEPATEWEARVDAIIEEQEKTLDETRRKELFNEMQVIYSEEVPLILLMNSNAFCGFKTKWQNRRIITAAAPPFWNIEELWAAPMDNGVAEPAATPSPPANDQ